MEVDYDGNWKPFDESYANLLTNLEISKFFCPESKKD